MKKFLLYTNITIIALGMAQISAMLKPYIPSLNRLERSLVAREIRRRGTTIIYNEINWQSHQEKPEPLIICDVFNVKDAQDDLLAHDIFERIQHIEKHSGYMPEAQHITDSEGLITINATNCLGAHTRYYWAKDADGTHLPIISVYSRISDFNAVKEIIDEHDTARE